MVHDPVKDYDIGAEDIVYGGHQGLLDLVSKLQVISLQGTVRQWAWTLGQ